MSTRVASASGSPEDALAACCEDQAGPSAPAVPAGGAGGADGGTAATAGAGDDAGLRWQPLVLGSIPGVSEFLDTVSAPLEVIAAVLRFIAGILDVISKLLIGIPDAYRALVLAAYQILKDLIEDFLNSGVYLFADAPGLTSLDVLARDLGLDPEQPGKWRTGNPVPAPGQVTGWDKWAANFRGSFDNPGDPYRPSFSDGAPVYALFVVAAAPGLVDLRPLLAAIGRILDIRAFIDAWERYPGISTDQLFPDPDLAHVRGLPVSPGWRALRLRDIGPDSYPLEQLQRVPDLLKGLLLAIDDIISLIRRLVEAIGDKVKAMLAIVEAIQAIIDLLDALNAAGFYVLGVATDEGVDGLVDAFLTAEDRPEGGYVAGLCMLSGTSAATDPVAFWSLLGQGKSFEEAFSGLHEDWEALSEQAEAAWEDTKTQAEDGWEETKDLAAALEEAWEAEEQAVLANLGLDEEEALAAADADRSALVSTLEQVAAEGTRLDPVTLAAIEETRRARRRGRRALAESFGGLASPVEGEEP